ncbi:MAG: hypothetical protein NC416_03920 [Eubacterium sp.]|nr:hypothetical protein [Eubacterium sp.]
MKQDKVICIILTVVNAVLAVICIVLLFRTDRTEPKFIIQPAEITYSPDMDESLLYVGIAAHDDRDGEVTDRIVIEKKVENRAEGSVIVYYAVSDSAGNVAKFSKLFSAEYPVEVPAAVSESGGSSQTVRQLEMVRTVSDGTAAEENKSDADTGKDTETDTGEEPEEDGGNENNSPDGEDADSDEEAGEDHVDAAENSNEDTPEPIQTARNDGAPELVFRDTEVTIHSGANVPWTEIISTLKDDKDDYATLYYNLQVSQYNRNKPGIYPVTVYTEDSDGNRSQTVPVTITVR